MLQKITYKKIKDLIKDNYILNGFEYYQNKYTNLLFLQYGNEAIFAFTKNKNNVYEGQAYFIETHNVNKIIVALKEFLNTRAILYILNKNRKAIFENIKEENLYLKMHKYALNKKLKPVESEYKIFEAENNEDLLTFYKACFKDEFDENAKIWLRDFDQMEPTLKKGNLHIKIDNEIAASIMYWEMENSIFIFLLGTHPSFRRKKLAYFLIQHVQVLFPNKEHALTTWAETNTENFYLNIGFEKLQLAHICI